MKIAIWIVQGLLAAAFLAHGLLLLWPPPEVAVQMNASLPRWFSLFLGVAEVAAAVGLTLPALTRIKPWLVAWAAAGIMIVTASATVFHLARGEWSSAATTTVLFAMATCVAYLRRRAADCRLAASVVNARSRLPVRDRHADAQAGGSDRQKLR